MGCIKDRGEFTRLSIGKVSLLLKESPAQLLSCDIETHMLVVQVTVFGA